VSVGANLFSELTGIPTVTVLARIIANYPKKLKENLRRTYS
jgi:hypothetical protein